MKNKYNKNKHDYICGRKSLIREALDYINNDFWLSLMVLFILFTIISIVLFMSLLIW